MKPLSLCSVIVFMPILFACSRDDSPSPVAPEEPAVEWEQIFDKRFIDHKISNRSYHYWPFYLPSTGKEFRLKGAFLVTRGGDKCINAFVVSRTEFRNFQSDNNFYPRYERNRVTAGEFSLSLDGDRGPYYFILDNQFSLFTDKWVSGEVELSYFEESRK